jgi:molybdate transport system substrate-binding protein
MITRTIASGTMALVAVSILLFTGTVDGAEVKVMISGGFSGAYQDLVPEYERTIKDTAVTSRGASMGNAPNSIPSRLQRGEPVDVLIMVGEALDELIKRGKVVAGTRVDLARSSIGMAVRAGAPKPDISSVDAFKRAVLDARSIAYSASASGVYLSTELFQHLGIADRIRAKSKMIESESVGAAVARGEAEMGFQQISELLPNQRAPSTRFGG